ncbi:hypothetical protein SPRG_05774 [Saprolegnia parasitica CBS 223.65]|uniref:Uncharacterized protein n=1 Tax=Saprolegnia parasitica (strain CBS 223.65) TaxID=695850 RepID=A0A067CEG9_SAPPC|nr:hypothetical protein SPRG_05774 [Saprolegnia parasitica CBS 223.65]KDO28903.1 hypothetical protein SPRG_05774 [Saprolegnia parasitica CBS 223.65]|eukprot:XP_012200447.1 hypothetical protein SPRG_05774 [Saprolegnia parasitica CBS 223.65]
MQETTSARESAGVVLFDASDTRWSGVCTTRTSIMLDLSYLYDPISQPHDAKGSGDATTNSASDTTCSSSSTTEALASRRRRRRTASVVETGRHNDAKWFTPVSKFIRSLFRPRDRDSLLLQRTSKYYK